MKKIAVTLLLLYCFFVNTVFAEVLLLEYDGEIHNYTGDVYSLVVNGKKLNNLPLDPIIFNDRAVVPVREVFEAMGATVIYNGNDNSVTVNYGKRTVKLTIGMHTAIVDGLKKTIPDGVGAKLIAKWGEYPKTMVPVRFISESLGFDVGYDGANKIISVSDNPSAPVVTQTPAPTVAPTTAPVPTPNVPSTPTAKLTKLNYSIDGDTATVTVSASSPVSSLTKAVMTASGVVYADVYGAVNGLSGKTEINQGVVVAVRTGQHDGYTRIAIDTNGVKKYSATLSADSKIVTFTLSGNPEAVLPTSVPVVTPTPPVVPVVTETPKPIVYNPNKIVVIDAGHGGSDPGAGANLMTDWEKEAYHAALDSTEPIIATMQPGSGARINEKDVALTVAHKVRENLEANGIQVIMTRTGDTYPTLDSRPALANEEGAVIFVSIHLNSTTTAVTAAKGIEIYYSTQNNDNTLGISSKSLADDILKCVIDSTDAKSRGVKSGNLLVNRKCMMPSALIEIGFMNNPDELELMINEGYQDKLAAGIARGIINAHSDVVIP